MRQSSSDILNEDCGMCKEQGRCEVAHSVQATVWAVGWRALAATRAAWRASSSSETGAPAAQHHSQDADRPDVLQLTFKNGNCTVTVPRRGLVSISNASSVHQLYVLSAVRCLIVEVPHLRRR